MTSVNQPDALQFVGDASTISTSHFLQNLQTLMEGVESVSITALSGVKTTDVVEDLVQLWPLP